MGSLREGIYFLSDRVRSRFETSKERHKRERMNAECLLISLPNCGRTWLRLMIGRSLQEEFGITDKINPFNLYIYSEINSTIPSIKPIHEQWKRAADYWYRRVILLVRDPRDVLVSRYFGSLKAGKLSTDKVGDVSEYILKTGGYLKEYITFYNAWKQYRNVPRSLLLVRYEDMKKNASRELERAIDFLGLQISNETIENAVEYSSFDNMRKLEREGTYKIRVFEKKATNPDSYKTREGKAGNYKKHLSAEAIAWIEKELDEHLDPDYGYNYFT